ncbi:DUF2069 domain-containing protein [Shewanella maritima]|uniref:DUF2069 domain-containing protein n=1 Tax=Shewanella maritima TaxID=2520507 RepID=UPI0037368852
MPSRMLFQLCRIGYISLLALLAGWFIRQGVNGTYSMAFSVLWVLPLLLPLKGIIQGNPYTYAWASFILCLYLLHGLTLLWVSNAHFAFAAIETTLLCLLLIGFPFYARKRGRELGLSIKKKKAD